MFNLFKKKEFRNHKTIRFYFIKHKGIWITKKVYQADTGVKFILSTWSIDDNDYNQIYAAPEPPSTAVKVYGEDNMKFVDLLIDVNPTRSRYFSNWLFDIEKSSVKSLSSVIKELVLDNTDGTRREALKALGVN